MGEKRGTKALEAWCRKITDGYRDVTVQNMSTSWRDGLAFCAIIHHFRPDLIDYESLSKENIQHNNELAFDVAEKHLGIPSLLDAEDMVKYKIPDKLSIMTYVSQFYQYFQGNSQQIGSPIKTAKRPLESPGNSLSSPDSPPEKVISTACTTSRHPDVCQACHNRVYILERLIIDNKLYHRTCFKCCRCNSVLKPAAYVDGPTTGKYECTSCPDEEEAEKAAIATMASARLAHLKSPTNQMKWELPPVFSPVKTDDTNLLSNTFADARKAFLSHSSLSSVNNTQNLALSEKKSETKEIPSLKSPSHLNTVSQYLFGSSDVDKFTQMNKDSALNANGEQVLVSSSEIPKTNGKLEKQKPTPFDTFNNESEITRSELSVISSVKPELTDSKIELLTTTSELRKPEASDDVISESNNDSQQIISVANQHEESSDFKSFTSSPSIALDVQKTETENDQLKLTGEKTLLETPTHKNGFHPVPSPRSSRRNLSSYKKMDKTESDKSSEDLFTTPQSSPDVRLRRKQLDLDLSRTSAESNSSVSSKRNSSQSPVHSSVSSVYQKPASTIGGSLSPSRSGIVVHDMPVIQPQLNQRMLSPPRSKSGNSFKKTCPIEDPGSVSMTSSFEKNQRDKSETLDDSSQEMNRLSVASNNLDEEKDGSASQKHDLASIERPRLSSVATEQIMYSNKDEIDGSAGNEVKLVQPKKTPPPRPKPPAVLLESKSSLSSKSPVCLQKDKDKLVDYPDELNPFMEDDENNNENYDKSDKPIDTKKIAAKSLNPFEESDEEYEDAMKPEDVITSTPKKIPFGLPENKETPKQLTKIEAPRGLNPFEDDEDEIETDSSRYYINETENSLKDCSLQSSTGPSEKPRPLPRRTIGTRSQSGSPAGSLSRTSGFAYASSYSATSSPIGSLSKATGRIHDHSDESFPATSPLGSLSKAGGRKYFSSKDLEINISPTGSISKATRKKRPAPKPPMARSLFSPREFNVDGCEKEEMSSTEHKSMKPSSPRLHKKSPAPPPPHVKLHNEINAVVSEKMMKDIGNNSLKYLEKENQFDGISSNRVSDPNLQLQSSKSENMSIDDSSPKQKNTFGYWKKKKPAPPVPLPPKRQTVKLPLEEIHRELAEIEEKQLLLEKQGVDLEKAIRQGLKEEDENAEEEEENDLVFQLFELVNEKNVLFRRQSELIYLKRQQRLEEEHAELEFQIRCLIGKPENDKTEADHQQEEELINRLIEVVKQRNEIIESMEIDRLREAVEDKNIQEQLAIHQAGSSRSSLNSQGSSNSVDHLGKKEKNKKVPRERNQEGECEHQLQKIKNKEKEKTNGHDEDKDLDDVEVAMNEKTKKQKKRKWF